MIEAYLKLRSQERISLLVILVLSIGLFAYTSYRASVLSFTYDESSTVLEYINRYYDYIFHRAPTATNHVLNSALMKFSSDLFGPTELILRLPNLFAHLIYLLFSFLLVWNIRNLNGYLKIAAFALLNFNPYLLDFFSLARGYGLAAGFTMSAIYFLYRHHQSASIFSFAMLLLSACLAVLSNFSVLNLFLGIIGLYACLSILNLLSGMRPSNLKVNFVLIVIFSLGLFFLIHQPIQELIERNELFFGGETGVWSDTIRSLINRSTYANDRASLVGIFLFAMMFILMSIHLVIQLIILKTDRISFGSKLFLLFVIILVGLEAQHLLFDTRFIIERTALFLYPLFISAVIFSLSEFQLIEAGMKKIALGSLALLMVLNSASAANDSYTLDWKHEAHSKQLMHALDAQARPYETILEIDWPYSVTCRFYAWLYEYRWLRITENASTAPYQSSDGPPPSPDMKLMKLAEVASLVNKPEKVIPMENELALVIFLEPKFTERSFQANVSTSEFTNSKKEYFNLFKVDVSELSDRESPLNFKAELNLNLGAGTEPNSTFLVCEIGGTLLKSSACSRGPNEKGQFSIRMFHRDMMDIRKGELKFYLWNRSKGEVSISNFSLSQFNNPN